VPNFQQLRSVEDILKDKSDVFLRFTMRSLYPAFCRFHGDALRRLMVSDLLRQQYSRPSIYVRYNSALKNP